MGSLPLWLVLTSACTPSEPTLDRAEGTTRSPTTADTVVGPPADTDRTPADSAEPVEPADTDDTAATGTVWTLTVGAPRPIAAPGGFLENHGRVGWSDDRWVVSFTRQARTGDDTAAGTTLVAPDLSSYELLTPDVADGRSPDVASTDDGLVLTFALPATGQVGLRWTVGHDAGPVHLVDGATAPLEPHAVDAAVAPDGHVLLVWSAVDTESWPDGPEAAHHVARFAPDGRELSHHVVWPTAPGGKYPADIVALPDGRALAAVHHRAQPQDPSELRVYVVTPDGDVGPEPVIVRSSPASVTRPSLALDDLGRLALAWREGSGDEVSSYVAVYEPQGDDWALLADPMPIGTFPSDRPVVEAHAAGWMVAWEEPRADTREIFARFLAPRSVRWASDVVQVPTGGSTRYRAALADGPDHWLMVFDDYTEDGSTVQGALLTLSADAATP